jgi:succinate dehydrogenase/fumarate reductase flavoprotein subunit
MIADEKLWVIRHGKGLQSAVEELRSIATNELPKLSVQTGTRTYNKEWIDAIQVQNLAIVLEASARSGLMRKESRGVHYRSDYPKTDNDNWLREIIVRQANGRFSLSTRPVTVTKFKLPHGKFSFEEGIIRAVERLGE